MASTASAGLLSMSANAPFRRSPSGEFGSFFNNVRQRSRLFIQNGRVARTPRIYCQTEAGQPFFGGDVLRTQGHGSAQRLIGLVATI